jgi:hypothetical protein
LHFAAKIHCLPSTHTTHMRVFQLIFIILFCFPSRADYPCPFLADSSTAWAGFFLRDRSCPCPTNALLITRPISCALARSRSSRGRRMCIERELRQSTSRKCGSGYRVAEPTLMACTSIIHRRLFYFVVSLFSIGGAGVAGARVYSLHYNLCPFIVHDKVLGTD